MTGSSLPSRADCRQITSVALQGAITAFRAGAAGLLAAAAVFHCLQDHLARDARIAQQGGGKTVALTHDAQHQMLGGHILVLQLPGFFHRLIDHAFQPRGDEDLGHRLRIRGRGGRPRGVLEVIVQPLLHDLDRRAHAPQHLDDQPLRLFEQRQKDVLDIHLRVAVALHHFIGTPGSLLGLLGELVKTHHDGCASLVLRIAYCVLRDTCCVIVEF